jgi:thiol-disulfide isomerase/thioredoxin
MTKTRKTADKSRLSDARWQMGIVMGVLLLVVAVLALKRADSSATAPVLESEAVSQPLPTAPTTEPAENPLAPLPDELPEAHIERLLADGHPMLVFFHSTSCSQCIEMTKIVGQVHPEFSAQVALVNVNVYDERNRSLLQRAGIRVIPTLIFFDGGATGKGFSTTGVMPAEQLRGVLTKLSSGDLQ